MRDSCSKCGTHLDCYQTRYLCTECGIPPDSDSQPVILCETCEATIAQEATTASSFTRSVEEMENPRETTTNSLGSLHQPLFGGQHYWWHVLLKLDTPLVTSEENLLKQMRAEKGDGARRFEWIDGGAHSDGDDDQENSERSWEHSSCPCEERIEHYKIVCDGCECALLSNVRYCCLNCVNFDLCESCGSNRERFHAIHDRSHCLLKVRCRVKREALPYVPVPLGVHPQDTRPVTLAVPSLVHINAHYVSPRDIVFMRLTHRQIARILSIEEHLFGPYAFEQDYFHKVLDNRLTVLNDGQWTGKYMNHVAYDTRRNEIAGYIITSFKIERDNSLSAHVNSIAVDQRYQRRGIGEFMLRNHIHRVKKLKMAYVSHRSSATPICRLHLHVSVFNLSAQRLYSKLGFKTVLWVENYYQTTGEDALRMEQYV